MALMMDKWEAAYCELAAGIWLKLRQQSHPVSHRAFTLCKAALARTDCGQAECPGSGMKEKRVPYDSLLARQACRQIAGFKSTVTRCSHSQLRSTTSQIPPVPRTPHAALADKSLIDGYSVRMFSEAKYLPSIPLKF